MTREEKIKFCRESALELMDVEVDHWGELTDEQLDEQVEWFDYLWTK